MYNPFNDTSHILKLIAPNVLKGLRSPISGTAMNVLRTGLGMVETATEAEISALLTTATPEMIGALTRVDASFGRAMKAAGIDLGTIKKHGRGGDAPNSWFYIMLTIIVSGGFFGLIAVMAFHEIPQSNSGPLNMLLGTLGTAWTAIITFYFGSSAGSDRKTTLLANSISLDHPNAPLILGGTVTPVVGSVIVPPPAA